MLTLIYELLNMYDLLEPMNRITKVLVRVMQFLLGYQILLIGCPLD